MRFCCVTRYYHREARQSIQGANTVFPLVLTAQPSSRWVRSPLGIAGHRVRTCWVCGTAWHSLASQAFWLHILPFMIFSEISSLNVPCTWALMDFPGSPRQWAHRHGSRLPQGRLCFQAILSLFPGTREALCHLLSLFPKSKLSLVPGTLVHDHEDGNAKARKEKPSCFGANMLLKGCDSWRWLKAGCCVNAGEPWWLTDSSPTSPNPPPNRTHFPLFPSWPLCAGASSPSDWIGGKGLYSVRREKENNEWMCSCPLESPSCLQHVPNELANFIFEVWNPPSHRRGINWELPQWKHVEVERLSNTTGLGQGQHQAESPYKPSLQHAGGYLVTTNTPRFFRAHPISPSRYQPSLWVKRLRMVSYSLCWSTMTFLREIGSSSASTELVPNISLYSPSLKLDRKHVHSCYLLAFCWAEKCKTFPTSLSNSCGQASCLDFFFPHQCLTFKFLSLWGPWGNWDFKMHHRNRWTRAWQRHRADTEPKPALAQGSWNPRVQAAAPAPALPCPARGSTNEQGQGSKLNPALPMGSGLPYLPLWWIFVYSAERKRARGQSLSHTQNNAVIVTED